MTIEPDAPSTGGTARSARGGHCPATMTPARSRRIVAALFEYHGRPAPALEYLNPYQLAVAVVLSAQTTDKQVNSVTPRLFERYPGFTELAGARISDLEKLIHSVGFYRSKARNIRALAQMVIERHRGSLPSGRDELMSLPGVGRKSANVILAMGFGVPAFAVDTHVLRVSNRIGYARSDNPDVVEACLTAVIPASDWINGHLLFITHGRTVCKARGPLCDRCPVTAFCDFAGNNP